MRRVLFSVALVAAIVGCAPRQSAVATAPTAPAAFVTPEAIKWVRESAEHHAALYQVYRQVTARVEQAAAKRPAGSWGVILDADETVIDNALYQLERAKLGLGFTAESWNAWVKRREAMPLPGAAAFLSRVRALGGKVAIVTNRLGSECDDTRAVFDAHMLVYDAILCRPDGSPSDKNPRFEAVASGQSPASATPLEILAYVGDNIHDFPRLSQDVRKEGAPAFTDFGARYFLVPNPMYGGWQ